MAKLTRAELRKRAPNLPEAELKRLEAIKRFEEWVTQATRKLARRKVKRDDENFDPQKTADEKLRLLREKHEYGDPFAASEAFVLCHAERVALPRWAGDVIAARLREELGNPAKRKSAKRRLYEQWIHWYTVDYYRRKNFSKDEAIRLAALAYGGEEAIDADGLIKGFVTGQSTIEHHYKDIRRIRNLPKGDHLLSEPKGFENVTPMDLLEGPKRLPRPDLVFSALWSSYSQALRDKIMLYLDQNKQYSSAFDLYKSRPELFVESRRER